MSGYDAFGRFATKLEEEAERHEREGVELRRRTSGAAGDGDLQLAKFMREVSRVARRVCSEP